MSTAILWAGVSSVLIGMGTALQKHGMARTFPRIALSTFLKQLGQVAGTLATNWIWLTGIIAMLSGTVCFAYALSLGDISVVQPLINAAIVVATLIGVLWFKERLTAWEWISISILIGGVICISLGARQSTSMQPSSPSLLLLISLFVLTVSAFLLIYKFSTRLMPELTLSIAAGCCFGLGNVLGKIVTQRVIEATGMFSLLELDCWLAAWADFPFYLLVTAAVAGIVLFQIAFANGRVTVVSALTNIVGNSTPILAAIIFFNEQITGLLAAGIVLVIMGTSLFILQKQDGSQPEAI